MQKKYQHFQKDIGKQRQVFTEGNRQTMDRHPQKEAGRQKTGIRVGYRQAEDRFL